MVETMKQEVLGSLADSFEQMAFISLEPAEAPLAAPEDAVRLSIPVHVGHQGVVEMVTSRKLGTIVASNMLGLDPDDPATADYAEGALKEMLNIFAGLTLRRWAACNQTKVEMSLPELNVFDVQTEWENFSGSQNAVLLTAEGYSLAIRVRIEE